MKYDAYVLGPDPGWEPFPFPCRVVDAAGEQVVYCRRCDTETGEVERWASDAGRLAFDARGKLAVVAETRPAPLRLERLEPGEPYLKADEPTVVGG